MARYMKRNSIGRLVSTDNKNDLNIVEVRLSLVEYNALLDRLDQAEQAVADSKKDIEEIAGTSNVFTPDDVPVFTSLRTIQFLIHLNKPNAS